MKKKGNLITDEPIVWILGICVFVLIVFLFYQADIYSYIRNLPAPHSEKTDEVVDYSSEEYKDKSGEGKICPLEKTFGKINYVDGEYSVYFGDEKSEFIWSVDKGNGKILFKENVVAEVLEGKINVDKDYLDFDSEKFQKIRFEEISVDDFAKLQDVFYFENNLLCDGKTVEVEVDYGSLVNYNVIRLDVIYNSRTKNYEINFPTEFLVVPRESHFRSLYIVKHKSYFEIKGDAFGFDWRELGRIYSDGSIWFNPDRIFKEKSSWIKKTQGVKCEKEFYTIWRGIWKPYYESNIKITKEDFVKLHNSLK